MCSHPLLPGAFKVSQVGETASSSGARILLREGAGTPSAAEGHSSPHRAVPGTLLSSPSVRTLKAAGIQGNRVTATLQGTELAETEFAGVIYSDRGALHPGHSAGGRSGSFNLQRTRQSQNCGHQLSSSGNGMVNCLLISFSLLVF